MTFEEKLLAKISADKEEYKRTEGIASKKSCYTYLGHSHIMEEDCSIPMCTMHNPTIYGEIYWITEDWSGGD